MNEPNLHEVFNESYEFINRPESNFYELFYDDFIGSSNDIQNLFKNVDINKQKLMLRESILYMMMFYSDKNYNPYFVSLARKHKKMNVTDDMYTSFMDSLITALSKSYPKFDKTCELAWRVLFAPGIEFMKHIDEK